MDERFAALIELLDTKTIDQSWCTGYQLFVANRHTTLVDVGSGVDGLGQSVSTDSMFAIYCAGKPITALAIGALTDAGELSLEDVIGDILPPPLHPALCTTTVKQLLTHTAGLWKYPAIAFLTIPAQARRQMVRSIEPAPQPSNCGHYADFAAWELLAMVIEELTGLTFERAIDELVLDRCGLRDEIRFTMPSRHHSRHRLRVNADLQAGRPMPILWERSISNLSDVRPSGGAIASMTAMGHLYQATLRCLNDGTGDIIGKSVAEALTTPTTRAAMDPVLGRTCRYSPGFMTDLSLPEFDAAMNERTFGHSGLHGMTFAGADPQTDTIFAVHLNGVTRHDEPASGDPDNSPLARRRLICKLIADATKPDAQRT